jgi:D-inositol-3-phosphate glycosyltransferase
LKIALLSIHSSPLGPAGAKDTGGMSTYLRGLSKSLGEAGHQVDLFTRSVGVEGKKVQKIAPSVRLISFDDGLGPLEKAEIYLHIKAITGAIKAFNRLDGTVYRALFSHYWLSGCVGELLKQEWKLPHLIMFHTLGRAKSEACPGEREPAWRISEEESLAHSCDLVIVAADLEKERMLRYYDLLPEKIAVIPCGVDRDHFKPLGRNRSRELIGLQRRDEKIILAVGRIEPVKGFDLLIRAAGLLPADMDFKVLIAGGDKQGREQIACLKETAVRLGISERLKFTGLIEHGRLPLYYSAANLTAVPSYYESFGLTALESISCGTPVVGGPVGVIPELIQAGSSEALGRLVTERSPAAWAETIRNALHEDDEPIGSADIDAALVPFHWPGIAGEIAARISQLPSNFPA